jgi:putative restriction endonuclease
MIWLELRVNQTKYDFGWNFSESVWAPTKKSNGHNWPYWYLVGDVIKGDIIFHISKVKGIKKFLGYSTALNDAYITNDNPSLTKHLWSFSESFYKVDLTDYTELNPAIPISEFFNNNDIELRRYFETNKLKENKKRLFFVIQNEKLRCQNGGYFSEFDNNLALKLTHILSETRSKLKDKAKTDVYLKELELRVGHQEFSENVKLNFNYKCCFPGCNVEGKGFLISGHITRWADNKDLRGDTNNGLCLCLVHDKAFEKGFFTLNHNNKVILLKHKFENRDWLHNFLIEGENLEIKPRQIEPSIEALKNHWLRIGHIP